MLLCEGCGQEIAADDAFCRRCGRALKTAADARAGFMDAMAARFERRLKDEAADTDAVYNLALTHFYAGRYADALPLLRRVAEELPDYSEARAKLALALWMTGAHADGLAEMETAVAQSPADSRLRRWRDQMRSELESQKAKKP